MLALVQALVQALVPVQVLVPQSDLGEREPRAMMIQLPAHQQRAAAAAALRHRRLSALQRMSALPQHCAPRLLLQASAAAAAASMLELSVLVLVLVLAQAEPPGPSLARKLHWQHPLLQR